MPSPAPRGGAGSSSQKAGTCARSAPPQPGCWRVRGARACGALHAACQLSLPPRPGQAVGGEAATCRGFVCHPGCGLAPGRQTRQRPWGACEALHLVARDQSPLAAGGRHGDQAQQAARGAVARGGQRERRRDQLLRVRAAQALPGARRPAPQRQGRVRACGARLAPRRQARRRAALVPVASYSRAGRHASVRARRMSRKRPPASR
jgi:hypothetical protein